MIIRQKQSHTCQKDVFSFQLDTSRKCTAHPCLQSAERILQNKLSARVAECATKIEQCLSLPLLASQLVGTSYCSCYVESRTKTLLPSFVIAFALMAVADDGDD